MDDESRWYLEKNFFKQLGIKMFNAWNVFQSVWIRHNSIISDITDRKFVLRRFGFVYYFGIILWIIFLVKKTFQIIIT